MTYYSNFFNHLNVILSILGDPKSINCSSITLKDVSNKFGLSIKKSFIRLFSRNVASKQ